MDHGDPNRALQPSFVIVGKPIDERTVVELNIKRYGRWMVKICGGCVANGVRTNTAEIRDLIGRERFDRGEAFVETFCTETSGGFGCGMKVTDGKVTTTSSLGLVGHGLGFMVVQLIEESGFEWVSAISRISMASHILELKQHIRQHASRNWDLSYNCGRRSSLKWQKDTNFLGEDGSGLVPTRNILKKFDMQLLSCGAASASQTLS